MMVYKGGRSETGGFRLRRVRRPGVVIAFVILMVALIAGAFVAGAVLVNPADRAAAQAPDTIPVTYPVEERVVADQLRLPGAYREGARLALHATAPGGVAVVSRVTASVGSPLNWGDVVGEVSGRPRLAVPASIPLYRDIAVGDVGADVEAMESFLAALGYDVYVDHEFEEHSLWAVEAWYEARGYELDGSAVVIGELIGTPHGGETVASVAPVGTRLGGETPLVEIETTPPVVVARATVIQAQELQPGQPVRLSFGAGAPAETVIASVGAPVADESGAIGVDVTVTIPAALAADAAAGRPALVEDVTAAEPTLAVPVIAIRQEGAVSYVLVDAGADDPARRVDVRVMAQASGWAALAPTDALTEGDLVSVAP
ncbi:hypothetical protein [Microbacterium sp.]|uniref:hypothetical protein n=1 Tax=Microbacterium sp. TaxID=51671 RepID=UPI0039E648BF